MLNSKEIENPNAVEEIICKQLDRCQKQSMNEKDSELFVMLCLSRPIPLSEIKEEEKPFLCKLIEKRVKHCYTFTITDSRVILMIAQVSVSAGNAVLYIAYLQYLCKKNDIKELSFDMFCKFFYEGFFSDSDLQKIWDGQKIGVNSHSMASDNLIDYSGASLSIQFKTE